MLTKWIATVISRGHLEAKTGMVSVPIFRKICVDVQTRQREDGEGSLWPLAKDFKRGVTAKRLKWIHIEELGKVWAACSSFINLISSATARPNPVKSDRSTLINWYLQKLQDTDCCKAWTQSSWAWHIEESYLEALCLNDVSEREGCSRFIQSHRCPHQLRYWETLSTRRPQFIAIQARGGNFIVSFPEYLSPSRGLA